MHRKDPACPYQDKFVSFSDERSRLQALYRIFAKAVKGSAVTREGGVGSVHEIAAPRQIR